MSAVIDVGLPNGGTGVAGTPPIFTVASIEKPVPLILTDVPPRLDPDDGDMDETVTAGTAGR